MQHFVWGVLVLPLLGFAVQALWQRMPRGLVSLVGPGAVGLAFLSALLCYVWLLGQPVSGQHYREFGWHWTFSGTFHLDFALLLDPLSSTMTLIVTGVGFLIMVYSVGYMHAENGYRRFFAQMNLFIFTMLLLVLADNYLWLLIGWAGVGLTSYLLIGYYYDRPSAVSAARKAFVMNVIGDWGLMIAIFMMFVLFGVVGYSGVFAHTHTLPYNGVVVNVLALMLLVAAVAKSAQLPLYTWLPDAMEGPTPVSALIHAATMVTAGVYLIARSYVIFQQAPFALHVVAFIGAIGALYAATMGLTSFDIKRILAYSTMSQIAYMFVGVGVAVYSAGIFHLLEHAFFKAMLFMAAGAVMHALNDVLDIRLMGGLRRKMPITFWSFVIGVLAISGIPPFSGFFSKEDVIGSAFGRATHGDPWMWIVWVLIEVAAAFTALYMGRALFVVFFGQPRDQSLYDHAHDPGMTMTIPMVILAVLSVFGGWLAVPGGYNKMESWLSPVFHWFPTPGPVIAAQPFSWISLLVTLLMAFLGLFVAYSVYYRRSPSPQRLASALGSLYTLPAHRWYVDELYDLVFVRPLKLFSRFLDDFIERWVIDGAVRGAGYFMTWAAGWLRTYQTGFVRNYALWILVGAVIVFGYYVVGGR